MSAAFFAYFTILFVFVFFSRYFRDSSSHFERLIFGYLIPIIVVCILLGGRFETGSDWEEYKEYYDNLLRYGNSLSNAFDSTLEPLYMLMSISVASLGVGSSYFFAVVALVQFTLIYVLCNHRKRMLPYILLFYILGNLFMNMNILRQTLALGFVLISLNYFNRKWLFLFFLLMAVGFHYSAIIFLPVVFIDKKLFKFLDNPFVVVLLYIATLVTAQIIINYASGYIQMIDFSAKYSRNADNLDVEMVVSSGYGIIAKHLLNLLLIYLWSKIKHYTNDNFYTNAYRITVIGFLISNIFGVSVFLSRLALYYTVFSVVIWAYMTISIMKTKQFKHLRIFIVSAIVLNVLFFCMGIINGNGGCSPYTFKWIG